MCGLIHQRCEAPAGRPALKFFYVYVIISKRNERIRYFGITTNLKARVAEHNAGKCRHTSKFRPWRVEVAVAFRSEKKVRASERYLKTGSGREFSRRHF